MAERRVPQEPVALLLSGLLAAPQPPPAPAGPVEEPLPPATAPVAPAPSAPVAHLDDLDGAIEALLVAADRPLDLLTVAGALDRPVAVVRRAVERIRDDYDGATGRPRGFQLREVATGWRLYARPAHDAAVRALLDVETAGRLSRAALETLAVVAYRQPVTRSRVAAVRAVSVDSVLRTLVARGLVAEVGRDQDTGAVLYGTTDELLVALGIRSIEELPPLAPLLAGAEAARGEAS